MRFLKLSIIGVLIFGFVKPVYATEYEHTAITNGYGNKTITATDGDRFVWSQQDYEYSPGNIGTAVFYFDGQNSRLISSGPVENYFSAAIEGQKIVYLARFNSLYRIILFDITTGISREVTASATSLNKLSMRGNHISFSQSSYSGGQYIYDTAVYNINNQSLTYPDFYRTNSHSGYESTLNSDGKLYVARGGEVKKIDPTNGTSEIISDIGCVEYFAADGEVVAWIAHQTLTCTGSYEVYAYYNSTTKQITNSNVNLSVSVKNNYVMWYDNVHPEHGRAMAYSVQNDTSQVVAIGGSGLTTDGISFFYGKRTGEIFQNNYVEEPHVKNISTGQVIKIKFPAGKMANSKMVFGPNLLAWSGEKGYVGGTRYQQVYIAQLLDTPTDLVAQTPTNQKPSLGWQAVINAVKYNIYRSGDLIGSSTTNNFIDSVLAVDGQYVYEVTAVNSLNIESNKSNQVQVIYDSTIPVGEFSGDPAVVKMLNHRITGTASDNISGVSTVELISGTITLSTSSGEIVLTCDQSKTNCTWDANPATLPIGPQQITLRITDAGGSTFTTTRIYSIL